MQGVVHTPQASMTTPQTRNERHSDHATTTDTHDTPRAQTQARHDQRAEAWGKGGYDSFLLALALDYAVLKIIRFAKRGSKILSLLFFLLGFSRLLVAFPMRVSKGLETLLQSYS